MGNQALTSAKLFAAGFAVLVALTTAVFGYGNLHADVKSNSEDIAAVYTALAQVRIDLGEEIGELKSDISANDSEIVEIRERLSRLEEGQKHQTTILLRIERNLENDN